MKKYFAFVLLLLVAGCSSNNDSVAQSDEFEFRDAATGLDTPWEITWGPDGWIWMTERYGRISRVNPVSGEVKELLSIEEVFENGERGLMGLVLHPDFENTPHVFIGYNFLLDGSGSNNERTRIRIARYTYDGEKLTDPFILKDDIQGWWNHDGCRLWITDDEKLLVTIGDAAQANLAQMLDNENGKLLRMNLDGSIPEDNPFPDSYIWSYGHRNQQGLVVANGKIYTAEHGPNTDDEINLVEKGKNYGWPVINGYCDTPAEQEACESGDYEEALLSLTPQFTYAICGLDYYNHGAFPEWKNSLIVVSLKMARITVAKLNEEGDKVVSHQDYLVNNFGRIRDLCISPDGRIFIATSNKDGRGNPAPQDDRIIEITPKTSSVNKDKGAIEVYPNPAENEIHFKAENIKGNAKIFDSMGNLVKSFTRENIGSISWNLITSTGAKAAPGIYLLVAESYGKKISRSFVVAD